MTEYKCEEVLPYEDGKPKVQQVAAMFNNIAENYDPMNKLMSLGNDRLWRNKAIDTLKPLKPKLILDIATGTGDFAISSKNILSPDKVIGIDISEKMLEIGRQKVARLGLSGMVDLQQGDSCDLAFGDGTFDIVTVAFGVRNFENLRKGLKEINRVLREGGVVAILELSEPQNPIVKFGYKIYTKVIIPAFAKMMGSEAQAYDYLPNSIAAFPQGDRMKTLLCECGFSEVRLYSYTLGTCSFYYARK